MPTRRAILQVLAAAAVLPGTRSGRAEPDQEPAPKGGRHIRKAVKFGMVAGEMTVLEKFRLLRELGFDGVEMPSPADLDLDEVVSARDETGLVIHGVVDSAHWREPLSAADPELRARGRRALEQALRDCRRYGGDTVLLVPAVVDGSVSYEQAYRRSQAELRVVLPLAEELGVAIALENVWNNFLLSPLEAARYVDELASPRVGWYLDVGNVVRYGWPEHWIAVLGRRILKLDIKEYSRSKRDNEGLWKGFDVALGEGDCNWPAVMAALDGIGYEGWATAELAAGDAAYLADLAARMDRILSQGTMP